MQPQQPQPQQVNTDIKWIQGEAGAKSYMVAPNTTVTLWDTESDTIYVKSADASGLPSLKVLDYKMRGATPQATQIQPESNFATKDDVESIRQEIEALKAKFKEGAEA